MGAVATLTTSSPLLIGSLRSTRHSPCFVACFRCASLTPTACTACAGFARIVFARIARTACSALTCTACVGYDRTACAALLRTRCAGRTCSARARGLNLCAVLPDTRPMDSQSPPTHVPPPTSASSLRTPTFAHMALTHPCTHFRQHSRRLWHSSRLLSVQSWSPRVTAPNQVTPLRSLALHRHPPQAAPRRCVTRTFLPVPRCLLHLGVCSPPLASTRLSYI
jgi:hypothetical protein